MTRSNNKAQNTRIYKPFESVKTLCRKTFQILVTIIERKYSKGQGK